MREVMLTLIDAQRTIHSTTHDNIVDSIVAALAAEPETIEELEIALSRFIKPTGDRGLFNLFRAGTSEERWNAGQIIIDLAARIVAFESTYTLPQPEGEILYNNGASVTEFSIYYRLSDDWLFTDSIDQWRTLTDARRAQRINDQQLDARAVLYGKVSQFIVEECVRNRESEDPVAAVHARWLMTPRQDLRGSTPRELLLAKCELIEIDLQWRANQWSMTGECPPHLSAESKAYRFAGFGTNENVLYYMLLRYLITECWQHLSKEKEIDIEEEIRRLDSLKQTWMFRPQSEMYGMSPSYVTNRERERTPIAMSAKSIELDDDCDLCVETADMADMLGPMFWHLDGSSMDDDFPFSFHLTREDWEEERRQWEEFNRKWEQRRHDITDVGDDLIM